MTTGLLRACLECGELSPESRCKAHKRDRDRERPTSRERGYNARWDTLSRRARAAQPWCSDCLMRGDADNPLTLDHAPAAWQKVAEGKRLTMKDCAAGLLVVRCMRCNNAKGAARGNNVKR